MKLKPLKTDNITSPNKPLDKHQTAKADSAVLNDTPKQSTKSVPVETLKAYAGITEVKKDTVTREEIIEYLKKAGVKNEEVLEAAAESICNEKGVVSRPVFDLLETFLVKDRNINHIKNYFSIAKEDGEPNIKVLQTLNRVIVPSLPIWGLNIDYSSFLRKLKDRDGHFNSDVLDIIMKDSMEFSKAIVHTPTAPTIFIYGLKKENGEYDPKAVKYAKKEVEKGRHFPELTKEIKNAKNKKGNFSINLLEENLSLNSRFEGATLVLIKDIYDSIPKENKEEQEKLIKFSQKYKNEYYFRSILRCIKELKSAPNSKLGLKYDSSSFKFVKKFESYLDTKKMDNIISLLNAINQPYKKYSDKEIEEIIEFALYSNSQTAASKIINLIQPEEGKEKSKHFLEEIKKVRDIIQKTRSEKEDIFDEISKCLYLEKDNTALDFIHSLYTYKFDNNNSINDNWDRSSSGVEINKSLIRTITKILCETGENGIPKHCFNKEKIKKLKEILPQNAPIERKQDIEKSLLLEALSLPHRDYFSHSINFNAEELCSKVLQHTSGEKIRTFADFIKNNLKNSSNYTEINLNENIKTRLELYTGMGSNFTNQIFDLELGKVISKAFEFVQEKSLQRITSDFLNNTETIQQFEFNHNNAVLKNCLVEQELKKYDPNGNLLYQESVKPSKIKGVFDIDRIYADGRTENLSKASITKNGTEIVEKNMTSLDGTKTYYQYKTTPSGSREIEYEITDAYGKTLLNHSATFEVLDQNHFVSSRNGDTYYIEVKDNQIEVTKDETNEKVTLKLDNFLKNSNEKLISVLKQLPGEELFLMKKLELKAINIDEKVGSAAYNDYYNEIIVNPHYVKPCVILHEWGHAKDILSDDFVSGSISRDPLLLKTYKEELDLFRKNMPDTMLSLLSYYTADHHYTGNKAIKEGVAETNTILSINPKQTGVNIPAHYWQQYFPKTIAHISDMLYQDLSNFCKE